MIYCPNHNPVTLFLVAFWGAVTLFGAAVSSLLSCRVVVGNLVVLQAVAEGFGFQQNNLQYPSLAPILPFFFFQPGGAFACFLPFSFSCFPSPDLSLNPLQLV